MKFTKKHEELLLKSGKTLETVQSMSRDDKDMFINDNLIPFVCGDGTPEQEELAEDLITMITVWSPGQIQD